MYSGNLYSPQPKHFLELTVHLNLCEDFTSKYSGRAYEVIVDNSDSVAVLY
ncbi:hypothetical protein CLV24_1135 [Pontibacter ummariensis]|uniref:Uncharacterized protein n=1 Tax=Pontibacter ummariensis TaxID=1610492 RepID=A0A239HGU6_9BACT|nr:hypothetical protein CLV24_1135 [Pontibacter ummariensis]SNS80587.1 hypothetical protein SAMN06296052_113150 [Pontibacter ummariensis]